jgi:hypothetical protein
MKHNHRFVLVRGKGFTLIELLVVIAHHRDPGGVVAALSRAKEIKQTTA